MLRLDINKFSRLCNDRCIVLNEFLKNLSNPLRVFKTSTTVFSKNIKVKVGDVVLTSSLPKHPELVPVNYICKKSPQTILQHLRWIMQKDILKQDIFLIGPPGPLKRSLVMQYLELTKKEVEYISLSRDTTESDLKQRREIKNKSAHFIDQCAVRAAIEGRILVVEGIEKAERNVLPVLNNLLENREMQLEDGRFLMAPERYDKLLMEHSKEELDAWKLVRVSENFRVIALGLPVPRYQGNPLDPPLRSRFQARDINALPINEHLNFLRAINPNSSMENLVSFAYTMLSSESQSLSLPDFPVDQISSLLRILKSLPSVSFHDLIARLYPYNVFIGKEGQAAVGDTLKVTISVERGKKTKDILISNIEKNGESSADVLFQTPSGSVTVKVPAGRHPGNSQSSLDWFVSTNYHKQLLSQLMQSHLAKDFCIIGSKGCGKSALVSKFADMLNYEVEPVILYQDMTARDLIQQRSTTNEGDTIWKNMPLVTACLQGKIAVLDGLHRVNPGTLAIIHRLVHDRELQLFDGKRILRHDRYDRLKTEEKLTVTDLDAKGVLRMHPAFRLIALAEPPVIGSSTQQWLNPELLTLFFYHSMRPLSLAEETEVVCGRGSSDKMRDILKFTHAFRKTEDATLQSVATSLSVRQLMRIHKRLKKYPNENANELIQKACLSRFLPSLVKLSLNRQLQDYLEPSTNRIKVEDLHKAITSEVKDGVLRIGSVTTSVYKPEAKTKVPDVLFYDNAQHLSVMEDMLKDFLLGEHLLLVGNQGVGKNKIVDRFLHLLNRPREYIQLHRDTTVQTLTLQPTVRDGVIVYEDSPLVKAVKNGHVLVVDEADKAPTHVTCILKTLIESGEMILADGRRIVIGSADKNCTNIIPMHPDFRLIVLANRPGFPFLGNDFFSALGDIFSCHAVDNPSMDSEVEMLQKYGPNVPRHTLEKLVEAFSELRSMADEGLIAYPYSTREVVNIVKHLETYPNEGLATVVRNVFDFDPYDNETWDTLLKTLHKHGIPVGARATNVKLAKEFPMPDSKVVSTWELKKYSNSLDEFRVSYVRRNIQIKKPSFIQAQTIRLDREDARSLVFTEEQSRWNLPIDERNVVVDIAVTKSGDAAKDRIHIATANPISLYSMNTSARSVNFLDLYHLFQETRGGYRPRIKLACLGGNFSEHVLLHEEIANKLLLVDPIGGAIQKVETGTVLDIAGKEFVQRMRGIDKGFNQMCRQFSNENLVLFYEPNSDSIEALKIDENCSYTFDMPFKVKSFHPVSKEIWLIVDNQGQKYLLKDAFKLQENGSSGNTLKKINETSNQEISAISSNELRSFALSAALNQKITAPNRMFVNRAAYANVLVGFPDLSSNIELHSLPRPNDWDEKYAVQMKSEFLTEAGQIVTIVPNNYKPVSKDDSRQNSNFIEVVDFTSRKLRYVPLPPPERDSPFTSWINDISPVNTLSAKCSNDNIVTVDAGGTVRMWETGTENIERSIAQWKSLIGQEGKPIQVTIDETEVGDLSDPKHGKEDPLNAPHVGGDTWAGGTGGRSTAGLGGIGGPYRLDAGHDVHQVPDSVKNNVPKEVREAARAMGQKAFKERLKQIQMTEHDAALFENLNVNIQKQVQSLRVLLDSLQAKSKERRWLKHQTSGELDDMKLIEGLTGEKSIYKRRGDQDPEMGAPQEKPKRLRLLVDVSGSMYRFNGYDGRLHRMMEAALLVMQAFENYPAKFKYEIIGHSGEAHDIEFVKGEKLPENNKQKLDILKTMHAHAQFCMSGDNTLESTVNAINTFTDLEADERFVIVLSDANLERYGISAKVLARALTANPDVNAYAIFIGSLGDQAER
uniref:von Willebrand factor A domain-containing protein 8 n=1 Tax=Strigamia maritima TaxID=126957 RepID=T1INA4_STRMM